MELQKHLYYVQGWAIARLGRPLFEEDFQAWKHGPVVPRIYRALCEYNRHPIPTPTDEPYLRQEDQAFIASVWEQYKSFTAAELVTMTHQESPWVEARGDTPLGGHSDATIGKGALEAFFRSQMPAANGEDELLDLLSLEGD